MLSQVFFVALVAELRTRHDALNQAIEPVPVALELRAHAFDEDVVGKNQAAAERVGQQLARQIVDEIVLTMRAQVSLQPFDPTSRRSAGEGGRRVDGAKASPRGLKTTALATSLTAWRYFVSRFGDMASDSPELSKPA